MPDDRPRTNSTSSQSSISNEEIAKLLKNLTEQSNQIIQQNTAIKQDVVQINENISDIKIELSSANKKISELESENRELKKKIETIERKNRKYNIVLYGLEETNNQIKSDLLKVINEKLNVTCDKNEIRDCHRIGKETNEINKHRPIVAELSTYELKQEILSKAKTLEKGSRLFITQDYTPEVYEKRKLLHKNLVLARQRNYSAYIQNNTLFVNGDKYTYEDLSQNNNQIENLPTVPIKGIRDEGTNKEPRGEKRQPEGTPPEAGKPATKPKVTYTNIRSSNRLQSTTSKHT
ncbi:unnamed protein product [Phaedon cochleariae]|uniref:Endonuclease-reverse transcriptase n=1 Tax=Phaedon cochleariae TaxID=80249 RepID=A0A9P0DYP7_PHACE|nr:unnamed protein product [Phaedon cochleariae]